MEIVLLELARVIKFKVVNVGTRLSKDQLEPQGLFTSGGKRSTVCSMWQTRPGEQIKRLHLPATEALVL
jgi:hypothetical protein